MAGGILNYLTFYGWLGRGVVTSKSNELSMKTKILSFGKLKHVAYKKKLSESMENYMYNIQRICIY